MLSIHMATPKGSVPGPRVPARHDLRGALPGTEQVRAFADTTAARLSGAPDPMYPGRTPVPTIPLDQYNQPLYKNRRLSWSGVILAGGNVLAAGYTVAENLPHNPFDVQNYGLAPLAIMGAVDAVAFLRYAFGRQHLRTRDAAYLAQRAHTNDVMGAAASLKAAQKTLDETTKAHETEAALRGATETGKTQGRDEAMKLFEQLAAARSGGASDALGGLREHAQVVSELTPAKSGKEAKAGTNGAAPTNGNGTTPVEVHIHNGDENGKKK